MTSQPLDLTALVPVYTESNQVQRWLNTWQVTLDEFGSKHHIVEVDPHYSNVYPDLILQKLNRNTTTQSPLELTEAYHWDGRVLVVDDDAINRLLFKRQFEKLGLIASLQPVASKPLRC